MSKDNSKSDNAGLGWECVNVQGPTAEGGGLCVGMWEAKLKFREVKLAGISQKLVFGSVSGLIIGEQKGIQESHLSYLGKVSFFVDKLFEGNKKVGRLYIY